MDCSLSPHAGFLPFPYRKMWKILQGKCCSHGREETGSPGLLYETHILQGGHWLRMVGHFEVGSGLGRRIFPFA